MTRLEWFMPVIPLILVPGMLRQEEHHMFKAILGYKLSSLIAWATEIVSNNPNSNEERREGRRGEGKEGGAHTHTQREGERERGIGD